MLESLCEHQAASVGGGIPSPMRSCCKHGHAWIKENLRIHRGHYECRVCHGERELERNRKNGARARIASNYCPHGHLLVAGNLKKNKDGRRICLTCHRLSGRRRYHKNPKLMVEKATAYAKANRPRINERMRKHRKTDIFRLRARASSMRKRALQYGNTASTDAYRDDESLLHLNLLMHDPCSYCGMPMEAIDHIVPLTKDGTEDWTNLTATCKSCNSRKNNKSLFEFLIYTAPRLQPALPQC